eukprot:sb/3470014/
MPCRTLLSIYSARKHMTSKTIKILGVKTLREHFSCIYPATSISARSRGSRVQISPCKWSRGAGVIFALAVYIYFKRFSWPASYFTTTSGIGTMTRQIFVDALGVNEGVEWREQDLQKMMKQIPWRDEYNTLLDSPSFFLFNYPLIMFCCLLFPRIPISLSRIPLFISLFFSLLKVSKLVSLVFCALFCQLSVCVITQNFDCFACHVFSRGIYTQ